MGIYPGSSVRSNKWLNHCQLFSSSFCLFKCIFLIYFQLDVCVYVHMAVGDLVRKASDSPGAEWQAAWCRCMPSCGAGVTGCMMHGLKTDLTVWSRLAFNSICSPGLPQIYDLSDLASASEDLYSGLCHSFQTLQEYILHFLFLHCIFLLLLLHLNP